MQAVADEVTANRLPGPALWYPKAQLTLWTRLGADEDRRRARRDALIAASHVMEHRVRTGAWPAHLTDAMPDPPPDPFIGKPLGYRREGKGFVIFSVGEDGTFAAKPGQPEKGQSFFRYPGH